MTAKKSRAQLLVTGTARGDRHRPRRPDPGGIGAAPGHLSADLAGLWNELAGAVPPGVGCASDRAAFELLARLVAKSRDGSITGAQTAHLRALLESFGLTPSGRQRLDVQPAGPPQREAQAEKFFKEKK